MVCFIRALVVSKPILGSEREMRIWCGFIFSPKKETDKEEVGFWVIPTRTISSLLLLFSFVFVLNISYLVRYFEFCKYFCK